MLHEVTSYLQRSDGWLRGALNRCEDRVLNGSILTREPDVFLLLFLPVSQKKPFGIKWATDKVNSPVRCSALILARGNPRIGYGERHESIFRHQWEP